MVTMNGNYAFERSERVGGHPALDFVNTVHRWDEGRPGNEYLVDYDALARWHLVSGLLDARALRPFGTGSTAAKRRAWRQARSLREVLYRLLAALADGRTPAQRDLDALHKALERTLPFRRLSAAGRDIGQRWDFAGAPPAAILGPVAWSAAELEKVR